MMTSLPRIQPLDPVVVNQIAAGEVIERPASVVKELLDNSLDAGATQLTIDVEEGGRALIRVVDDGCGIAAEDLPLAFASHATSKLRKPEDLLAIRTMGFRGEALASVGSVANVTLQSRPRGAEVGAEIRCDGGKLSAVRPWNGQPGTRIQVEELFFNVPARRHFLRSVGTEIGHIAEAVIRLALARPCIGLKLTHNGKEAYDLPASTPLTDRLRLFFGREVSDKLLPIEGAAGPAKLTGFLTDPACDRGNARLQYFFVNGRCIRDRTLAHAVQEAYHGLLMTGRYAIVFLFIELPPDQVDVNVHPSKAEVRFRDGQALHHFVRSALRGLLNEHQFVPRLQVTPSAFALPPLAAPMPARPWGLSAGAARAPVLLERVDQQPPHASQDAMSPPLRGADAPRLAGESDAPRLDDAKNAAASTAMDEVPLKAIQLHNAYLVIETDEGMLVVDQHALHERILFEQFKARAREGAVESQRLLIPEPVDLPQEEAGLVMEHREALLNLGLELQEFGGGTILVSSYPAALHRVTPAEILKSVAQHLHQSPKAPAAEQLQHDLLAMMACKAAVKAGDPLGPDEIATLLRRRDLVADAHHCPHGRPTCLYFSKHDLDRQFQRI